MILVAFLLLLGFGLVAAEVFFPSAGVLSVLAGLCLVASIVFGFEESSTLGWIASVSALAGLPIVVIFAFRIFPKTPMGRKMIIGGSSWSSEERAAVQHSDERLVGQIGQTVSSLRPAGIAIIDGERVDVVTRGEHVEANVSIRVLQFESNRLVVQESIPAPTSDQNS